MDADICNFAGASSKEGLFLLWFSVKSYQEGTRNIETLGHCARHSRIEIKGIPRQSLDSFAHPLSRKQKDWQQQERYDSDLPRENEHRRYDQDQRYNVADDPR